jgi:pimeloyl-ACP methyl ester carboxylesterase
MQPRHPARALFWRGVLAAASDVAMVTGVYPLLPAATLAIRRRRARGGAGPGPGLRAVLREWALAVVVSAARPAGFFGLPGRSARGPRPIILVHGYAMNRANFLPLAVRLSRAGLGPIVGFEYWTLGKTASAARRLGELVDRVLARTGADAVDIVGHSMGGVVGRYYVTLGGGGDKVANLVTLGSPHLGTDASAIGIGRPIRELLGGSTLLTRLAAAAPPARTRLTVIWSRADALVPGAREARVHGADELVFDDLGHLGLLASRRVAAAIIERLRSGSGRS